MEPCIVYKWPGTAVYMDLRWEKSLSPPLSLSRPGPADTELGTCRENHTLRYKEQEENLHFKGVFFYLIDLHFIFIWKKWIPLTCSICVADRNVMYLRKAKTNCHSVLILIVKSMIQLIVIWNLRKQILQNSKYT